VTALRCRAFTQSLECKGQLAAQSRDRRRAMLRAALSPCRLCRAPALLPYPCLRCARSLASSQGRIRRSERKWPSLRFSGEHGMVTPGNAAGIIRLHCHTIAYHSRIDE